MLAAAASSARFQYVLQLLLSCLNGTGWCSKDGSCAADRPRTGVTLAAAASCSARLRYMLLLLLSCLSGTGWLSLLGSCAADRPSRRDARLRGFVGSASIHAAALALLRERHRLLLDARLVHSQIL